MDVPGQARNVQIWRDERVTREVNNSHETGIENTDYNAHPLIPRKLVCDERATQHCAAQYTTAYEAAADSAEESST